MTTHSQPHSTFLTVSGWPLDLEAGSGIHPAAGAARPATAAGVVAGARASAVPDPGGVGHGERCSLGGTSPAHGRGSAARGVGGRARRGARADADGASGAGGPGTLSGRRRDCGFTV